MAFGMRYELVEATCTHCEKKFQAPKGFPNPLCRECSSYMQMLSDLENKLLNQGFSLGQEDEKLARQIALLLKKEVERGTIYEDTGTVDSLLERLFEDEKRRMNILNQIKEIQKKKKKK